MNFFKYLIASIRWGKLTDQDRLLIASKPIDKILRAPYIRVRYTKEPNTLE